MKRAYPILFMISIFLASCGLGQPTATISPDLVKTQVSGMLTQNPPTQPVATQGQITEIPTAVVTTTGNPSPTANPTNTAIVVSSPTPQATQAPTLAPTPTSLPSSTPAAGDPRSKLGNPTFNETFANDQNWPTGDDEFTSLSLTDHSLVLKGLTRFDGWRLTWPKLKDFYLEATFKPGPCTGSDRYGLAARVPDLDKADQAYLVGATCDGKYSLRKWNGEKMTNLIEWSASKDILPGQNQSNRIGLLAKGSQLSVYINGVLQKTIQDAYLSEGSIGIFVGANQTQNFSVTVTQFAYWENPNL